LDELVVVRCQKDTKKKHSSKYMRKKEQTRKQTHYSTYLFNNKDLKLGTMAEQFSYTIPTMKRAMTIH
jgi:hypothetical protein